MAAVRYRIVSKAAALAAGGFCSWLVLEMTALASVRILWYNTTTNGKGENRHGKTNKMARRPQKKTRCHMVALCRLVDETNRKRLLVALCGHSQIQRCKVSLLRIKITEMRFLLWVTS